MNSNETTGGGNTVKVMRKVLAVLCMLCLLAAAAPAAADDSNSMKTDGFSTSYSYNYDY